VIKTCLSLVFTGDASTSASTNASNQVKTKFDLNTSTRNITRTFRKFENLFRSEVIWILCFHWQNITACGKYPFACVMPKWYFVFTCCSPSASINAGTKKFDLCACACAYACVKVVFPVKTALLLG